MDEGLPIAYQVLEEGVPVYTSDGVRIGSVDHVVAAPDEDIFHGIVIRGEHGRQFVAGDQVTELHEHGVDLAIDSTQAANLPDAHGQAAPAYRVHEPGVKPSRWKSLVDMLSGARPHRRDWDEEN